MKRKVFNVFGLLLGLGAGTGFIVLLMATRPKPKRKPAADSTPLVEVITASPGKYDAVVTGFGVVRPSETLTVVSEVAGKVLELGKGVGGGALLEKDSLLFRIDDAAYQVEKERLTAQIEALDSRMAELRAQNEADRKFFEIEQDVLNLTEKEYRRLLDLSKDGNVSESQLEAAETRVKERKLTLEKRRAFLSSFKTRMSGLEASRRAAQASRKAQILKLEKTTVRAPYRLRIMDLKIRAHQVVQPGAEALSIYPVGAATEISVPIESRHMTALFDIENLKRGTPPWDQVRLEADVSWMHFGRSYRQKGHLARLAAQVDPNTRTLTAFIELPGPEKRAKTDGPRGLLPGTFVKVEIRGRTFQEVIVLPDSVLESRNSLYVVREGRFHRIQIEPIVTLGQDVLFPVRSALPAGAKVVTTEVPGAFDGSPVRIFQEGRRGK